MLNRLFKGLVTAAAFWFVNSYRRLSVDLIKIEAATYYIKAIQSGRQGFLSALLVWLGIFFFALGVVLLHAGLFLGIYLLTESLKAVVITILILGGIYVITIALIARRLLSEQAWMKFFKADKLVADLTEKT